MSRLIYVEKQMVVPAGGILKSFVFQRSGEKNVFLHTLRVVTDSYTSSARIYIDGEVFSPAVGPNTTFDVGKPTHYDKIEVRHAIEVEVSAASTGSTSVWAYAYLEVE